MPPWHWLFSGLALGLSSSPRSSRRHWCLLCISTCYWRPVVHWKQLSAGRRGPQGKSRAGDLLAHLYLRKFCFVAVATQPRADHLKPASCVGPEDNRSPVCPAGSNEGAGRSPWVIQRRLLCNYWACGSSRLMCQSLQRENKEKSHIHRGSVLLLTSADRLSLRLGCCPLSQHLERL